MAVLVTIEGPAALADVYDTVIGKLEAEDLGAPSGRASHVVSKHDGGLTVVDVWDDPDSFGAFAARLEPLIAEAGGPRPEVRVLSVHNEIRR
jgi:hypothetical protein